MKTFDVDVEGKTYEVDAPDENTAWRYAQTHHRAEQVKLEEAGKAKGGEYKIGEAGFRDAAKKVADETGAGGRYLQGAGETFDRYAYGTKGLFTELSPEEKLRLKQNKIMSDEGGLAATLGQVSGELAINIPTMVGGGAGVQAARQTFPRTAAALERGGAAVAEAIPGSATAGRIAQVAVPNAAMGALGSPEERGRGATFGAVGSVLGAGVNRAVGGALRPYLSREGQELIEQGVQPTPGQAVGGRVGMMEEKLGSVPGFGDIIGRSRNRAIEEYNQALAGRTAQQIGGPGGLPRAAGRALGETGDDALLTLRQRIGDVYETVLDRVPQLRVEAAPIARELQQIVNDPALAMNAATSQRLIDYVNRHLLGIGQDISGQVAKRLESDMGKAVTKNMAYNASPEDKVFGEALQRIHQFWRNGIANSLPQAEREMLQNANQAWRGFQPLDVAASKAGSQQRGGVFTPRVLRSALAAGDKSQSDNVLRGLQQRPVAAAGNPYEYNAAMSRAGRTLGDVVPDSGTAGRTFAGAAAVGSGLAAPATLASGAAALGATALAYSRMGSALLTQGAFPATREAASRWLASQGVPPQAIPQIVEHMLASTGRAAAAQPQQAEMR